MREQMQRSSGGERGFTLIELAVVLVILGLLIGLALPSYLGARKRAAEEEARQIHQEWQRLTRTSYTIILTVNAPGTTTNSLAGP